jgi:hypothetical protein
LETFSHYVELENISLHFVVYASYVTMFQIDVIALNKVHSLKIKVVLQTVLEIIKKEI